ncbi:putative Zn-dependent protease [Massilia sp. MP_M2]|uniref:tetratricopeptide repeat protein n=1 Tax=Massilia sp. MP_M2 TaxID=3071713 RepID=UPI00319D98EC
MIRQRLLPMLIGVAALAGCATDGTGTSTDTPRAAVSGNIYVQADAALAARQPEKAILLLKSASVAHPVDKKPWVRMAQIRFDASQYGEAISHAQEALARDPNDTLAYSILAVSGLRVASKALADLTRKNNLQGSVRSEAQDLARLLRTSLGEEVLVSTRPAVRAPVRKTPSQSAAAASRPAPAPAGGSPFDVLK